MDQGNATFGIGAIRRKLTGVVVGRKESVIPNRMSSNFPDEKLDIRFGLNINNTKS